MRRLLKGAGAVLTGPHYTPAWGEDPTPKAQVRAALQDDVDALNAQLNRRETIKNFAVLPRDLSEETGELTASLKDKRKTVEENFGHLIEAMYAGT